MGNLCPLKTFGNLYTFNKNVLNLKTNLNQNLI